MNRSGPGGRDVDWLPFPWFITALATLLWWPLGVYWQSDDWIALRYSEDAGRALRDLTGNQYGLTGLVQFWRPLVTLSFWLEQTVAGGPSTLLSHLANACGLGLGAMLLGRITARFLGAQVGLAAAAIYAFHPLHAGSVLWAVGRVDTWATFWILAALLAHLRWRDQRSPSRALAVACGVAALATKELAVVLPGLVAVLEWSLARAERLRQAWSGAWPYALLLLAYLGWRLWLFGGLGGYEGGAPALAPALAGFAVWTARVLDPLLVVTSSPFAWLGLVPAVIGVAGFLVLGCGRALAAVLLVYAGTMLPTVQFWAHVDEPKNLRHLTLPFAALAVLLAAGGRWNAVLVPLLFAWPHIAAREDHLEAGVDSERRHAELRAEIGAAPAGWHFVEGLPRELPSRSVYQFHLGVDRLLPWPHRLFALRPLAPDPAGYHPLVIADAGVPQATTWTFASPGDLRARNPVSGAFQVVWEGPSQLGRQTLYDLRDGKVAARIRIVGERAQGYRLTLFTAGGYLTTLAPDQDGTIDVRRWLAEGHHAEGGHDKHFLFPLAVATTLDLELAFPLLVEASDGRCAGNLLAVTFDRDLADMVRQ